MNVMVARRSFVEKNRDAVKRFQQAYADGTYQFMTSREKGVTVLSKRLRFKNPKGLEETYDYFARALPCRPECHRRACATRWKSSRSGIQPRKST